MRTLKIGEAADILGVSHSTLRAWEQRFGYPTAGRTPGKHREYAYEEIAALRDAMRAGLSISSAVNRARGALESEASGVAGAMLSYEVDRADAAMETSLALRSMERSVEEVLLPSLEQIACHPGTDSVAWSLASRWADGWLFRARHLAPAPAPSATVMVGDATGNPFSHEALILRALELFCVRSGVRIVTVPVEHTVGVADSVSALAPKLFVLAGRGANDLDSGRWVSTVRSSGQDAPLKMFRRPMRADLSRTASSLPEAPYQAHQEIVAAMHTLFGGASARFRSVPAMDEVVA